jgi:hypothetical protein
MSEHTPGPWELVGATRVWKVGDNGAAVAIMAEPEVRYSDQFREVDMGSARSREACANARLIAAAPDLLAALREYVDRHEAAMTSSPVGLPEYDQACAAIAKAEGR